MTDTDRLIKNLSLLFCLLLSAPTFSLNLTFQHIDVKNGLAFNSVRDIAQDKNGYMWFGTELGLSKFDGVSFTNYSANKKKSNSIAGSYVRAVEVDDENTLWVSSSTGGISKYNRATDDFSVITHNPNNSNSLSSNNIMAIQHAKNGILWIATAKGIDRFNTKLGEFKHFSTFISTQGHEIPAENSDIRDISLSEDGTPWSGGNKGLAFYDRASKAFMLVKLKENTQPTVLSIAHANSGKIWVGTREGLFLYDSLTKTSEKIDLGEEVKRVHSLKIDSKNNVWVGTSKFGIFRIDSEMNTLNFRSDKSSKQSLTGKTIFDLFIDHSGLLWVATYNSGINTLNPKSVYFGSYDNSKNSFSCLPTNDIRSALAVSSDVILLGTVSGLVEINIPEKSCKNYSHDEANQKTLSNDEVFSIYKTNNGNIWIGTSDGINLFDRATQTFRRFITTDELDDYVDVYQIQEYNDVLLLASSKGLYRYSLTTKKLIKITSVINEFNNSQVYSLVVDHTEKIWVASDIGLFLVSKSLKEAEPVLDIDGQMITGRVRSVAIDAKRNVWFTIDESGIHRYSTSNKHLQYLGDELGLKIRNGFSGLFFNQKSGHLWLSTYNQGLIEINTSSNEARHFQSDDGLHSDLFNHNSYAIFADGRLFFGGRTGFNLFHPEKISKNSAPPIITLTKLLRFGKEVLPKKKYDDLYIDDDISTIHSVRLNHLDSIFGFRFMGFDYHNPTGITYSYILENFDKNWTETSAENRGVTYNNINPGNYVFRVKAKNSRGIWSKNDVALDITIAPAPWLTWWAYTIYLVTFILLILFSFHKRTRWLKNRAIELESTVNIRTKELATEKEKVEQLLSRKNEEFANVSHEFRTPLTLILGPINQLVAKSKDTSLVSKLNIVQRNALRLLRMVDQLLNLETFRVKAITQKSPQAIGKITQLVAEAFADLAEEKQIIFNIQTIESVCFDFTPDAFEKIILNLLSNAIKYTKSGGTITISATRNRNSEYQVQVTDTGIGIAEDKLTKVFERFNRVMDENSEQVTGSGIGLALVKSLVESHDGSVKLESELGKGTSISVSLPIINELDESEINVHQNDEIIAMELMNVSSSSLHENILIDSTKNLSSSGKPTVLIIEDNDDMRQYIVESITPQFNTLVAADGQAGLELATQEVPDLIISDIMMPKLDGYQTTKALREAQVTNHIPVVLLTARGDRDSRLKGWEEKADEYITKPFDVEELLIRVSNLIEIRNILKRRFSETVFEKTEELALSKETEVESDNLSIVEINTQRLQQEFIEQLNKQRETVYMEAELAVIDIAKSVNMSERQFYRKLRSVIDMTPSEYLRRFRLEKSKGILRSGKTANFTAFEVGFSSQAYFSKCFKAQYNMTPKQFVNQS